MKNHKFVRTHTQLEYRLVKEKCEQLMSLQLCEASMSRFFPVIVMGD